MRFLGRKRRRKENDFKVLGPKSSKRIPDPRKSKLD